MHAGGKKFLVQTCKSRRLSSPEHVWRYGKIELIDESLFQ